MDGRSEPLAGVSIDSRTVAPGELFFAVRGERYDAHDFVPDAIRAGAVAAVVSQARLGEYDARLRLRLLAVDEPLAALQRLAREWRMEWGRRPPGRAARRLVGVTGSVGKTTTKEILAALLGTRLGVLKSSGNLNNQFGVPLTLLRLGEHHDVAVLELGMSRPGEIKRLAWMACPEVGLVTRVAAVHLEFFSSLEEIARAKCELIEGLAGEEPVAVLNADDPRVAGFAAVLEGRSAGRGRVVTFGAGDSADFRALRIEERGLEGTEIEYTGPLGRATLQIPLPGRHNALNALAALAAASCWGIGAEEARRAFAGLAPSAMRGEVLRFEAGYTILSDCYNSSPAALAAVVQLLASTPGYRRRILVVGEMLELGPSSTQLHRESGAQAAALRAADWIFAVQGQAAEILRGAREAGHPAAQERFFATVEEAAAFLAGFFEQGDLVLVKGSRGVHLEKIIEALRAHSPLVAATGTAGGRN
jgi:UDP-N-acetylmuramoyl-tripeptide--D-alanyl-D-alanine ligase